MSSRHKQHNLKLPDRVNIKCNKLSNYFNVFARCTLNKSLLVEFNINKCIPYRASSYVQLPKTIRDRKAIINIKNNDQFAYSIVN